MKIKENAKCTKLYNSKRCNATEAFPRWPKLNGLYAGNFSVGDCPLLVAREMKESTASTSGWRFHDTAHQSFIMELEVK